MLCAPKQLRHYHSPDKLSWDQWRLSDRGVEHIDLENAANPQETDELDEMTAEEMAVHGYYVVAVLLGDSSCMVKITPNAPNLDHAENHFFTGSVIRKQNVSGKKLSFLPFVPFWAFSRPAENKKQL